MANTKRKTTVTTTDEAKMNAPDPKKLDECLFFKRLGFELSDEQKVFRDAIYDPNIRMVACNARSGSGKTTIAVATACLMIECGLYDEIFYCFSTNNGARESLGFLPGSTEEKEASFYEPCLQALVGCGYQPEKVVKEMNPEGEKNGSAFVSCRSHAFLRGTNINDRTILILDETQNCYWDEIKKILTRVKDGAKVVMIGHVGQIDIQKHPENSGFKAYINLFKDDPFVKVCQLTKNFRGHISEVADTMTSETFKKYREMELPFPEDI